MFLVFLYFAIVLCAIVKFSNRCKSPAMDQHPTAFDNTADLGSDTLAAFEEIKLKIKRAQLSDSLDYSLLEDQVMPECCESSPDIELKHKRIFAEASTSSKPTKPVAPVPMPRRDLSISVLASPTWQEKVSDESFLRTERLVEENLDESIESVIKGLNGDDDDQRDSSSDGSLNFNDTLERVEYYMSKAQLNADKKEAPKPAPRNKLMEEVQYSSPMRASPAGVKKTASPAKPKRVFFNSPVIRRVPPGMTPSNTPTKSARNTPLRSATNTPVKYGMNTPYKSATNTPLKSTTNTPLKSMANTPYKSPFKLPQSKPLSSSKQNMEIRSPGPAHHLKTHDQYDDVISPVQYYIKNSPVVPMIKNVSPAKNYFDRKYTKNVYEKPKVVKNLGKENMVLPEKAYKSPRLITMIDQPIGSKLPKNNKKIVSIADKVPKPVVIKHIRRENIHKELSGKSSTSKQLLEKVRCDESVEDSFAHLPVKTLDVSYCIGKAPLRTHTLK